MTAAQPEGELRASNDLLESPDGLLRRVDSDGYLLFRSVLGSAAVGAIGAAMAAELQKQGVAVANADGAVWSGAGLDKIDGDALYCAAAYEPLVGSEELTLFMAQVFGCPVRVSRATNLRYQLPGDHVHDSPPHQDHFTVGPNSDFKTFWIPLMDIDRTVGGLAIAVGSHRGGLLEHRKHETAVSYQMEGREQPAVPLEDVPGTWMTTDYQRGDIVVFESCTVHRGLPNRSKVIRLSLDVRAQPALTPAGWGWSRSVPEMKEHRRKTLAVCQELGLTTEQFEKLMIEMHWRGIEAEPPAIRALASELF